MTGVLLGLILLAAIAIAPFVVEALRKPMDASARRDAPGDFAILPQGQTHYQWSGPEAGPTVVCVHGLTTPSFVWRSVAAALAHEGFRVLSYDLYGRGYSDRVGGPQDASFFNRHLDALLNDQQVEGEVSLIGYSMGGAIVTAYSAETTRPVKCVVLLAPAGMRSVGEGLLQRMAHMPLVSRWLMLGVYPLMLSKGLRAETDAPTSIPGINALQRNEMRYRGFFPAVHQSVVGMLTGDFQAFHAKLRDAKRPVQAIWGARDDIIPLAAMDTLRDWNPNVQHHVIAEAGHGVTYSHTDEVLAKVIPFLKGDQAA